MNRWQADTWLLPYLLDKNLKGETGKQACKRLTHKPVAEKIYIHVGKTDLFSVIFTSQVSKHISACVQLCANLCIRTFIYYLAAQTQVKTRPSVFEEMKYNLMLNMGAFLSLLSSSFITVWHSMLRFCAGYCAWREHLHGFRCSLKQNINVKI